MKKYLLLLILTFSLISCFQTGTKLLLETPTPVPLDYSKDMEDLIIHEEQNIVKSDRFQSEEIIRSYKKAYPDRISEISFRNDDWAMKVYDQWFLWADGRLLPEEQRKQSLEYNPYPFYKYPKDLPIFQELPRNVKDRLDNTLEERKTKPLQRFPGFLNSLWRIYDRETSWARVKTTYFLSFKLQIHRDLLEDLANVEEELLRRMLADSDLRTFVQSLERVDGYNWRPIAETETLSVHSYGIALDLILGFKPNSEVYWLWSKNKGLSWYDVPYNKRFSPPESFIKTFEKYGFIWGGKWLYFDTIHFEYRPEILILNGLM
jgi:hypothetical protein